ncbi:MAG: aminopeptidase, partial [Erysipelotrichaceae bacterium]|nr:aminopeptidase [Erysipelotrichaceae bacterium]
MLHNYAKLLIHTGVNLRKGEYLILEAPTDAAELVRECTKVAFERGAKDVIVFYTDALNDKIRLQYAEKEEIEEVKDWQAESRNYYLQKGACSLLIKSSYPYLFEDVPGDKSSAYQSFTNTLRNNIRASIRKDGTKWCIASYPNPLWAKTLYPDCDTQEAVDKMFNLMCEICQIQKDKEPSVSWMEHI